MSEWQPIETAEKGWVDSIDVWNGQRVTDVFWAKPDIEGDDCWCVEEYERGYGYANIRITPQPTHWMQVPKGPK
jgi:hypothetical protein